MARIAKSLDVLRSQVNRMAPGRSKASDGWIGDAAHASRPSDHNPNQAGVVCALDITHDPLGGMDCHKLAKQLEVSRDPRIKYVIWHGQIMSGAHSERAWKWREYTGPNPHKKHLHVSVVGDAARYDRSDAWQVGKREPAVQLPDGDRLPMLKVAGVSYAPVRALAEALGATVVFDEATGDVKVSK